MSKVTRLTSILRRYELEAKSRYKADYHACEKAYREWLRARADFKEVYATDEDSPACEEANLREDNAFAAMAGARAHIPDHVAYKAEMLANEIDRGGNDWSIMLGSIMADVRRKG